MRPVADGDGAERVKVVDFGIAKALGADDAGPGLTQAGYVVGTPEYMSPEQLLGGQVDARSDVYALACVVFEMIAGESPFSGSHPQAIFAKHLQAPVPKLRVVRPTVSDELQQVIETGLAKVAADRYDSAGTFASALEAAAAKSTRPRWRRPAAMASSGPASRIVGVCALRTWKMKSNISSPTIKAMLAAQTQVGTMETHFPDEILRLLASESGVTAGERLPDLALGA